MLAAVGMVCVPALAGTLVCQSPTTTAYVWDPVSGTYVERIVTYAPVYEPVTTSQTIIVTAPRDASEDYLINNDVANTIADDATIRGHVETQTFRNAVTLGGRVETPGMVDRVEQDARSVDGVSDVENRVRPMVGEH
jgi:hypothetical protein